MDPLLVRRVAGVALILVFLLTFHLEHPLMVRVALLAMAVVGLWLAVDNVTAVALTVGLLAAFNTRFGHPDPVVSWIYPAMAVIALIAFAVSVGLRFVAHMQATHEERWARRHQAEDRTDDDAEHH
jgi:uncharacterized membrane protein YccC